MTKVSKNGSLGQIVGFLEKIVVEQFFHKSFGADIQVFRA